MMTRTQASLSAGRLMPWIILLLSVTALAAAFIGQHFFGMIPCVLCLYQRIPYAITALLAVLLIAFPPLRARLFAVLVLCGLVFAIGAGLSVFHIGVEQHWWGGTAACTVVPNIDLRFEDLAAPVPPELRSCDKPDFFFLGLTLASYNGVLSVVLAIMCAVAAVKAGRR